LLDENLSPKLAEILADIYPETAHVRDLGLKSAPDPKLWAHAATFGYTIVTKDADFHHRSFLRGHPPKVIWLRLGNCSTRQIAALLVASREQLEEFIRSGEHAFLALP
jgi:predicted nuclease of predicted toxin-antitoxin system